MKYYYIDRAQQRQGPFTQQELMAKQLFGNTVVWRQGQTDWGLLCQFPDLKDDWVQTYDKSMPWREHIPEGDYKYCPICGGTYDVELPYSSIYDGTSYKCKQCGYGFTAGGTVIVETSANNLQNGDESLRFAECSRCRRINSHLCVGCQNASLQLVNDTRKFYYIHTEGESYKGPVEAFLLPYMGVFPDSYVWTQGMKNWDFAGNVFDTKLLTVNLDYCPMCSGTYDVELPYSSIFDNTGYKCRHCGFAFHHGGTRTFSSAQREYSMQYYKWNQYSQPVVYDPPTTMVRSRCIIRGLIILIAVSIVLLVVCFFRYIIL